MTNEKSKYTPKTIIKQVYERYIISGMASMAMGLFASLIIGVLFSQLAKIPLLGFLTEIAALTQNGYIIGATIGVAIAYGFKSKPLVMFSSAVVGALGYSLGGPLGAYIAVIVGSELAGFVAGKTPFDIIISPFVTIITGGIFALLVAPAVGNLTLWLGRLVNSWAALQPFVAGILISLVVGMSLTSPISSAGLCASIGITGIASGAAIVGCAAQMIGFAVISFKDNGIGGLFSIGLGSSKIQLPNVLRHPQIWLAPSIASAVLGPVSTCWLKLEVATPAAAGMGTCCLVGPLSVLDKMGFTSANIIALVLVFFVAPAIISYSLNLVFKKLGWVKDGYFKLHT